MESAVQTKILNLLKYCKAFVFKTVVSNKGGIPDVIACVPLTKEQVEHYFETHDKLGIMFVVEVKDTGKLGELKPLQGYQLKKVSQAGGLAMVADDVQTVKTELEKLSVI